jgi:predicted 3-demethylubiquinone-9 3-methyltransferase (glyoxalase superfamily)
LFLSSKIGITSYFGKEGFEKHGMPVSTIMTMEFEIHGQKFVALNGVPHFTFNESVSFFVYCVTIDNIEFLYKILSQDGSINMPLDKYDWSDKYAWVKDKFGVSWQVIPTEMFKYLGSADKEKSCRAMNAMLQMNKLDLKLLQKAFDGK